MTDWFYDREHPAKGVLRVIAVILALLPLVAIGVQILYRFLY
jgi:hypothetical protein